MPWRLALLAVGLAICASASVGSLHAVPVAHAGPLGDELSATDGTRTLAVSKANNVSVDGEVISVEGSGYDVEKGIYVAFCVIPAPGSRPTPCGGGVDMSGGSGASIWISSNPPPYGVGLATPYGEGGTFSVDITVGPKINDSIDCRDVPCALVTFNDHTRLSDRSQDVLVPVSFGAAEPTATSTTVAPTATPVAPTATPIAPTAASEETAEPEETEEAVAPTATAAPVVAGAAIPPPAEAGESDVSAAGVVQPDSASADETPAPTARAGVIVAPVSVLSSDGRAATSGALSLRVSKVTELDPKGESVNVAGAGYDDSKGVYVALCAIPAAGARPSRCAGGSSQVSAWISSNPAEYASALAKPYADGGSFSVSLALKPVIDAQTDCRVLKCAVMSRNDDVEAGDRSQELVVPVTFAKASTQAANSSNSTPTGGVKGLSAAPAVTSDDGDGMPWLLIVLAAVGLVAVGAAAFGGYRMRSARRGAL